MTTEGDQQDDLDPDEADETPRNTSDTFRFVWLKLAAILGLGVAGFIAVSLIGKPLTGQNVSKAVLDLLTLVMVVTAMALGEGISTSVFGRNWKRLGRWLLYVAVAAGVYYAAMALLYAQLKPPAFTPGLGTLIFLGVVAAGSVLMSLETLIRKVFRKPPRPSGDPE